MLGLAGYGVKGGGEGEGGASHLRAGDLHTDCDSDVASCDAGEFLFGDRGGDVNSAAGVRGVVSDGGERGVGGGAPAVLRIIPGSCAVSSSSGRSSFTAIWWAVSPPQQQQQQWQH